MSSLMASVLNFFFRSPVALQVLLALAGVMLLTCIGLGVTCRIVASQRDAALQAKAELSARLQLQNQAVEAWQKEAASQKVRAEAAAARAATVRVKTETKVERIAAEPVPDGCSEAVTWGAKTGAEIGKDWEENP